MLCSVVLWQVCWQGGVAVTWREEKTDACSKSACLFFFFQLNLKQAMRAANISLLSVVTAFLFGYTIGQRRVGVKGLMKSN